MKGIKLNYMHEIQQNQKALGKSIFLSTAGPDFHSWSLSEDSEDSVDSSAGMSK